MKTKPTLRMLALAALLLATINSRFANANAQGTAFSYQGLLNNGTNVANGRYSFAFSLYNANTDGSIIGTTVTNNAVGVSNGWFTTTIDFGPNAFTGASNWLQIAVATNGSGTFTNLSPRQQLTPAPYAVYAETANAGNLIGTLSGDGSGLTNLTASQLISGTVADARLSTNVALLNANQAFTGVNNFSTRVGIGTNNPQVRLQVVGTGFSDDARLMVQSTGGTLGPQLRLNRSGTGGDEWVFVNSGAANGPVNSLQVVQSSSGTRLLIATNGNIGIGTTTPGTALQVNGTITATNFSGSGGGLSGVAKLAGGNAFSGVQTISGGKLGLGTATPDGLLGVSGGDIGVDEGGQNNGGTSFGLRFGGVGSSEFIGSKRTSGGNRFGLDLYTGGTARISVANNGNVGVGTTSPARKLTVSASGYGIEHTDGSVRLGTYLQAGSGWLGTISNDQLSFFVNDGNSSLTINTNGFVGIGTTAPATQLEVLGEITCVAINLTSDRNAKEKFSPVNARAVLDKVASLPISEWQYKRHSDARHIGPMAQDFSNAFSLGTDDKHISVVDEGGVALAAIQGLNQKLEERDEQIGRLRRENEVLMSRLEAIEKQLGMARQK